jgi:hypothetical protein
LAGDPPDTPTEAHLSVLLTSIQPLSSMQQEMFGPGKSLVLGLANCFDYEIRIGGIPKGHYLKDLLVGGVSRVRRPLLRRDDILSGASVRFLVARDGGMIAGTVSDKDGKVFGNYNVVMIPEAASSAADLSTMLAQAITDQNGVFLSLTLAPGKYRVMATPAAILPTPEFFAKLWALRAGAAEVEVRPNSNAQVTLAPSVLL